MHSPLLIQAIIDAYLREGLLPGHLERICRDYLVQLNTMLECFSAFPQGTTHTDPEGGLFIWGELPEGIDGMKVFSQAVEDGVAFVPGTHFYPDGGHLATFRLNFSMSEPDAIREGMGRLARAIEKCI